VTHTVRTSCTGCGRDDLEQFLDLGFSPVADAYTTHPASDPRGRADVYPLRVAVCGSCHLVQLLDVLDGETLFGTGYSFHSSASAPLSAYHAAYARDLLSGDLAARGVVEIGCNDGDMLRHFAAAGLPAYGVDPAAGPVAVARSRGLDVVGEPFTADLAGKLRAERGPAGLVIANHVLAHVEDVSDVLAGVAALLADDGTAVVEVQYVADLLLNNAFDLVYHEHRNFFSLTSLSTAARAHGLTVVDYLTTDRQGGSIRVRLRRGPSAAPCPVRQERWLAHRGTYASMQGRAERVRERLLDCLASLRGETVAGYGAPAKLTTLTAFCGLDVSDIAWVQDTTTAKQGRFVPGTSIPIVAPKVHTGHGVSPDVYLLSAWNYAGPIMRQEATFTAMGGRWLVPFPAPVIL
jgi:SAM-dependent methyltransferase